MSEKQQVLALKPDPSRANLLAINEQVWIRSGGGFSVVFVHGSPWHRFATKNALDHRIVGAALALAGVASVL